MKLLAVAVLLTLSTPFVAVASSVTPSPAPLQPPGDVCGAALTPDDEQACYSRYIAERLYEQHTTGFFAVASQTLPVAVVLGFCTLGVMLARGGR